ncbi:hypothetical protein NPX13_g4712 [Xylaria arbuscula]|uniref:Uncharacterized protein n=1 Tax=Xylaria arbuscula TaxID=114810 RepID=A0A9W8NFI7_9PEZI|nr:hypothetical protein NPX13_g4712 [Xylaria arbuscula]
MRFISILLRAVYATLPLAAMSLVVWSWPGVDGNATPPPTPRPGPTQQTSNHAIQIDIYLRHLHKDIQISEQDLKADFYSYLGIPQTATSDQIELASQATYRRLSQMAGSKVEISVLGGVYRVLQSDQLRPRYDELLRARGQFFDL